MSSNANETSTAMLSEEPSSISPAAAPPNNGALLQERPAEPAPILPFKDHVIGVAKKTRGTLLGKPELKEHGEKILQGEASIYDDPSQLPS